MVFFIYMYMKESLFKIQKHEDVTFSDTYTKDGEEYGTCDLCNIEGPTTEHVCMSMVEESNTLKTSINDFMKDTTIELSDAQIKYYNKLFNMQHQKYRNNKFYKSIHKQMNDKKQLSKKQFNEFVYLIKNGRSKYEDNKLSTKH